MTPYQSEQFTIKMNEALDKQTMSWDNELRSWYKLAVKALAFASPVSIGIESTHFRLLLETSPAGINMNVVMLLIHNMDKRTANEMNVSIENWAQVLQVNSQILHRWNVMTEPTRKKILKEVELMIQPKRIISN